MSFPFRKKTSILSRRFSLFRGYLTIEASMLIPFIIYALASFIIFAFYIHDKVTLYADSMYYAYENIQNNKNELIMTNELKLIHKDDSILKDYFPKLVVSQNSEFLKITINKNSTAQHFKGLNSKAIQTYDCLIKLLIQKTENIK